jgi:hypothetical protein
MGIPAAEEAAREDEREAIAKMIDRHVKEHKAEIVTLEGEYYCTFGRSFAKAIRARKESDSDYSGFSGA